MSLLVSRDPNSISTFTALKVKFLVTSSVDAVFHFSAYILPKQIDRMNNITYNY